MPQYTPGLSWPRSDGTESAWFSPEEQRPSKTENWFELLPHSHEKYDLYEKKVGSFVAEKKGIKAASYRMPLPPGYALFAHHKPQPGGGERIDVYLKGCPSIGKRMFRSPNEFLNHAEWLLDLSKPLDDHSTCGCLYNNSSNAAALKKAGAFGSGVPKRPLGSSAPPPKRPKPSTPVEEVTAIVTERRTDMRSGRRFRKGELVWFSIDPIFPPKDQKDLPAITHWPGLVANAVAKAEGEFVKFGDGQMSASALSTAFAIGGGVAPTLSTPPNGKKMHTTYYKYHIRPLGFFSATEEVVRRSEDMLPWAVSVELMGGTSGWSMLGKESTRIMKAKVAQERSDLKGKGIAIPDDDGEIDARWKSGYAQRWHFKTMPREWDTAAFRLSIAIKIGTLITNAWTQTDKIDRIEGAEINPEDKEAIETQKKTLYQGLWWGGERLWVDDVVRLNKNRTDLPESALGVPSPEAVDRAVLFRIRLITVEISPDSSEERHSWRCLLYGDALEVVDGDSEAVLPKPDDESLYTWKAPKGYSFRQLNPPGTEVTVDIMDVAGRLYPDLLDPSTQNWFQSPTLSEEENAKREKPQVLSLALSGLRPGLVAKSVSDKWKEDLYVMVSEANKLTERDMKAYYKRLLQEEGSAAEVSAAEGSASVVSAGDGSAQANGEREGTPGAKGGEAKGDEDPSSTLPTPPPTMTEPGSSTGVPGPA